MHQPSAVTGAANDSKGSRMLHSGIVLCRCRKMSRSSGTSAGTAMVGRRICTSVIWEVACRRRRLVAHLRFSGREMTDTVILEFLHTVRTAAFRADTVALLLADVLLEVDAVGTVGGLEGCTAIPETFLDSLSVDDLCESFLTALRVSRAGGRSAEIPHRARRLLEERSCERLRVADVARMCGVNPSHLERVFKRHLGVSVHQYLNCVRVRRAATLIALGDKIEAVGLFVGFRSKATFYRAFRECASMTPGQFVSSRDTCLARCAHHALLPSSPQRGGESQPAGVGD